MAKTPSRHAPWRLSVDALLLELQSMIFSNFHQRRNAAAKAEAGFRARSQADELSDQEKRWVWTSVLAMGREELCALRAAANGDEAVRRELPGMMREAAASDDPRGWPAAWRSAGEKLWSRSLARKKARGLSRATAFKWALGAAVAALACWPGEAGRLFGAEIQSAFAWIHGLVAAGGWKKPLALGGGALAFEAAAFSAGKASLFSRQLLAWRKERGKTALWEKKIAPEAIRLRLALEAQCAAEIAASPEEEKDKTKAEWAWLDLPFSDGWGQTFRAEFDRWARSHWGGAIRRLPSEKRIKMRGGRLGAFAHKATGWARRSPALKKSAERARSIWAKIPWNALWWAAFGPLGMAFGPLLDAVRKGGERWGAKTLRAPFAEGKDLLAKARWGGKERRQALKIQRNGERLDRLGAWALRVKEELAAFDLSEERRFLRKRQAAWTSAPIVLARSACVLAVCEAGWVAGLWISCAMAWAPPTRVESLGGALAAVLAVWGWIAASVGCAASSAVMALCAGRALSEGGLTRAQWKNGFKRALADKARWVGPLLEERSSAEPAEERLRIHEALALRIEAEKGLRAAAAPSPAQRLEPSAQMALASQKRGRRL